MMDGVKGWAAVHAKASFVSTSVLSCPFPVIVTAISVLELWVSTSCSSRTISTRTEFCAMCSSAYFDHHGIMSMIDHYHLYGDAASSHFPIKLIVAAAALTSSLVASKMF
jgi:hypothetical protein